MLLLNHLQFLDTLVVTRKVTFIQVNSLILVWFKTWQHACASVSVSKKTWTFVMRHWRVEICASASKKTLLKKKMDHPVTQNAMLIVKVTKMIFVVVKRITCLFTTVRILHSILTTSLFLEKSTDKINIKMLKSNNNTWFPIVNTEGKKPSYTIRVWMLINVFVSICLLLLNIMPSCPKLQ